MKQTGRWLGSIAGALIVLAVCVVISLVALPWDTGSDLIVGTSAGIVVGAIIAVWVASAVEGKRAEPEAQSRREPVPAVDQRVSGGQGIIINGNPTFSGAPITFTSGAQPSTDDSGVVPPKA